MSSSTRDLIDKPPIYARAEIPTYWAVDLGGRRAVAHSAPQGGRYSKLDIVRADDELHEAELGLRISLPELFAAAER